MIELLLVTINTVIKNNKNVFFLLLIGEDEEEINEGYLDIVPDTIPEDLFDEEKKSSLSRSVQ